MDTATEAPQAPATFRERVKGLGKKQLVEIANDEFQLNVDGKISADIVRDTLIRAHEERILSALEQNQAAAQVFLERDPDEKLLHVIFQPLDFPNNPLKFSNDAGYGIRDRKNPKKNADGLSRMPTFFLIPGQRYHLPLSIINILKKLTYRDSRPEFDTETGMISGNMPIVKARFSFIPVLSQETMRDLATREFG